MDNDVSLDELLNGEQTEAVEQVEPVEIETPVEPVETARDEQGRFAKTGEDSGPPPPEPVFNKAVLDERRRRQEAEARAATLEAQLQAYQSPPPSVFEDEAGFASNLQSQAVQQAVSEATYQSHLNMSEMMVRQANPDFEAVKAEFLALAAENPTLAQQALSDPHPWNKAYQIAKNHKTMQEMGSLNIDDMKAKMRAEIMAEMQVPAPRQGIPSLTTERSVGARTGPAFSEPSLADFLR